MDREYYINIVNELDDWNRCKKLDEDSQKTDRLYYTKSVKKKK